MQLDDTPGFKQFSGCTEKLKNIIHLYDLHNVFHSFVLKWLYYK